MTYRTPDVYVEEISVFPPSVAEVETAIPAFIGYTGSATRTFKDDLHNVPTKVMSLLEYESLFGAGPKLDVNKVVLDDAGNFVRAELASTNTKYLYDSLRLFFNNGGGKCYIVSVGPDTDDTDKDKLISGLEQIAKQDEPTILLFPDAAALSSADDLAAVQQAALQQAGKLGDRVALLDTHYYSDKHNHDIEIGSFRSKLGINNLKYGTAYAPWLKLNYSKNIGYADVRNVIQKGGTSVTLQSLTSDAGLLGLLDGLDNVLDDITTIKNQTTAVVGMGKTVTSHYGDLVTSYQSAKSGATIENLFGYLYALAGLVDGFINAGPALKNADLKNDIGSTILTTLKPAYSTLIALEEDLAAKLSATLTVVHATPPTSSQWGTIFSSPPTAAGIPSSATTDPLRLDAAFAGINKAYTIIASAIGGIVSGANNYSLTYEQNLLNNFSMYANIIKGVSNTLTTCPPSGAIAGIYALVDGTRGVWKAPANMSLAGVIEPTYYFDTDDTDNLNVDAVAGKSINAIRAFSGKGTLIWGARTLAGNDNEWRYISVRRFFNMVEESVKKSTYWAVFEGNDANTWVKVRGMIENYLTQKWREGALAGATTKDAFFVRCGLGVTMNAQDILEGRMNVEIGMAVVRPAEFIILKFSHKLQTS